MQPFRRFSRVLIPALVSVVAILPAFAEEPAGKAEVNKGVKAGTQLLKDGDKLADEGKYQDAEARYEDAFEAILPSMRKLPFKTPVKRSVTRREDMKDMLIKEFEADMSPEEFKANEMAMKAFGFLEKELNLKELLIQVYSEEIAAFYDPRTKTMHLIREEEPKPKKPGGFFEQIFGKSSGFDKGEKKTVIAHELTHALADQNYNLDTMQEKVKKNDDRSMAVSALIEGEATLTMMGVGMDDWDGDQLSKIKAEDLDTAFSFMSPFLTFLGGGKSLKSAPPIISESMIFPYIRGLVFCAKLVNTGGWKGIDDAYKNPPLSTEQIIHPEKFREKPDPPMTIEPGELTPGGGWKELGRNVLGEMQVAILLRNDGGKQAAAGWDGDIYAVFEAPDHELGLAWITTWDTEKDAIEFAGNYLKYQTGKLDKGTPKPDPNSLSLTRARGKVAYAVERRGSDVAVVEGFSQEITRKLVEQLFRSTKTELTGSQP